MSYLQTLVERQNQDLHAARSYIERAQSENRELSVEERTAWDALNVQMDERQAHIDDVKADEMRSARVASSMAEAAELRVPEGAKRDENVESIGSILRSLVTGERRSFEFPIAPDAFEQRAGVSTTTTAGGYTIPEGFGGRIIEKMLTVGPMLNSSVVNLVTTTSKNDIPFPIENARATGTATAEGATYAESSPTFTQKTLHAFKYGTIVLGTDELFDSEEVGLQSYLARNMGVALGTAVNNALTLGTGTVVPEGIAANAGSGVTGGTGVSGVPTYANLIDLVHSVDSLYASQPSTGFMLRRSTLGAVRKIVDGNGAYIFTPAATQMAANTILGYPVFENPDVAATATAAKSVLFGDMSSFFVRTVGGIEVERSDQVLWLQDGIAFKGRIWVDGAIGQSSAIKYFAGGTA